METFEMDRLVSDGDDALIAELRRVASLVNSDYLTQGAFDKRSEVSSSTIRHHFGGWQQALWRAGLRGVGGRRGKSALTDEELLSELRAVSEKLGGQPVTVELFNRHAKMNAETLRRRFGSWGAAAKRAGVAATKCGRRYTEDELFENLLGVWTHYGRQPTYHEMSLPPSSIPVFAYQQRWGTWIEALLVFLARANLDNGEQAENLRRCCKRRNRGHGSEPGDNCRRRLQWPICG
jgi:hypothetical protein